MVAHEDAAAGLAADDEAGLEDARADHDALGVLEQAAALGVHLVGEHLLHGEGGAVDEGLLLALGAGGGDGGEGQQCREEEADHGAVSRDVWRCIAGVGAPVQQALGTHA